MPLFVLSALAAASATVNLAPVFDGVATLLGVLLAWLAWTVRTWVDARIARVADARARAVLQRAADFVAIEVRALAQTLAPAAKAAVADGKLTAAEARNLRDLAVHRAKQNLGAAGVAALDRATGGRDVDAYLASLTEAAVLATKVPILGELLDPAKAPAPPGPDPARGEVLS